MGSLSTYHLPMGDFDRGKTCGSPISTRRLYRQNRPKADGPNPRRLPLPKGLEHFCRAAGMKVGRRSKGVASIFFGGARPFLGLV